MLSHKEELFLHELNELIKGASGPSGRKESVGNMALRASLRWSESEFFEIKEGLIRRGYISRGPGRGGSVRLVANAKRVEQQKSNRSSEIDKSLDSALVEMLVDKIQDLGELDRKLIDSLTGGDSISIEVLADVLRERFPGRIKFNARGRYPHIYLQEPSELEQSQYSASDRQDLTFFFRSPAEEHGANLLAELLVPEELKDLLPAEYKRSLDREITAKFGGTARTRKFEYACALIALFGTDLLGAPDGIGAKLRLLIAIKRGFTDREVPGTWEPGGRSAKEFVQLIQFPSEFHGRANEKLRPHIPFPKATVLHGLEDYQKKAKAEILHRIRSGDPRAILMMPTGTGKTRTALETVYDWYQETVSKRERAICVWVAHTEELCEQALDQLQRLYHSRKDNNHHLDVFRFWGSFAHQLADVSEEISKRLADDECNAMFILSTNISFASVLESTEDFAWLTKTLRLGEHLLVIDEAHRAAASTYQAIIDNFDKISPDLKVLGLTATPQRNTGQPTEDEATEQLLALFGGGRNVVDPFENPRDLQRTVPPINPWNHREYLIRRDVLARPWFETLRTYCDGHEKFSGLTAA